MRWTPIHHNLYQSLKMKSSLQLMPSSTTIQLLTLPMTSSINKTPDNVPDPELLKAMEFVAKMKASADRVGAQFIGGFITEDGQRFVQTNLDDPEEVERRLPPELK